MTCAERETVEAEPKIVLVVAAPILNFLIVGTGAGTDPQTSYLGRLLIGRGARKLTRENLKIVWTEFSTLS